MEELLTRINMNDFLVNFVGVSEEEILMIPDYVKKDIIMDDYDTFLEFITEGV